MNLCRLSGIPRLSYVVPELFEHLPHIEMRERFRILQVIEIFLRKIIRESSRLRQKNSLYSLLSFLLTNLSLRSEDEDETEEGRCDIRALRVLFAAMLCAS